jgi:hypothetical protein
VPERWNRRRDIDHGFRINGIARGSALSCPPRIEDGLSAAEIDVRTTVAQSSTQISRTVEGTVIVLNAEAGEVLDLNRPASEIWSLIQSPRDVGALCEELCRRYDVDYDVCEEDVVGVLSRLRAKHLVRAV